RAHQFNPRRSLESLRGSLSHSLKRLPNGKWTWKYDRVFRDPVRRPQLTTGERASLWTYVEKIACPTLVVIGASSDVMSPETGEKMLAVLPAGSELVVVPHAGHVVHGDNPEGFERAVTPFLERWVLAG
ncbi:MAG: alpha/beta hydrolase, partial [Chloroflexi bacterium]|nr:alpha/beta hydrolase [Chloroflexota bacterium]